ncbi:hypothetical protein TNCV_2103161 [Trichonephila clavipes]|nr:hypothetical protein TNCV_2103161 [Trichonephila clavipes]
MNPYLYYSTPLDVCSFGRTPAEAFHVDCLVPTVKHGGGSMMVEVSFYYDLVLFVMKSIQREVKKGVWPNEIPYPSCDTTVDPDTRKNFKLLTALKQSVAEFYRQIQRDDSRRHGDDKSP